MKLIPAVAGVALRAVALQNFRDTMAESMNISILFNVGFAAIIAFGVVYNAARVSLSERSRELASLRVLGFTRAEISLILLGELAILTICALPVGAAIGYGLGELIISGFNNEVYRLSFVVSAVHGRVVVSHRHRRCVRVRPGRPTAARSSGSRRRAQDPRVTMRRPAEPSRCDRRPRRRRRCWRWRSGRPPCRWMSATVRRGPLVVPIEEEGQTRVRDRYVVSAPVAGRVLRIDLEPGDESSAARWSRGCGRRRRRCSTPGPAPKRRRRSTRHARRSDAHRPKSSARGRPSHSCSARSRACASWRRVACVSRRNSR